LFAVLLGAMGALAFEPIRLFPLLLLSYAGLVLLLDGAAESPRRYRSAAIAGWGFGFGFFEGLARLDFAVVVALHVQHRGEQRRQRAVFPAS